VLGLVRQHDGGNASTLIGIGGALMAFAAIDGVLINETVRDLL
jgi:hypothetical protein